MKTIFGNEAPLPGTHHEVHPMDLVMQLGRVKRFNGSIPYTEWSVAHHSLLCSVIWMRHYGADGVHHVLTHDFHEYVTGDIPSPVKNAIGRVQVEQVEDFIDGRIHELTRVARPDASMKARVKVVDWAALFIEAHYVGVPGHLKHIIDTSIGHLSYERRLEIFDCVRDICPEVSFEMCEQRFFDARYEP